MYLPVIEIKAKFAEFKDSRNKERKSEILLCQLPLRRQWESNNIESVARRIHVVSPLLSEPSRRRHVFYLENNIMIRITG